jgi:cation diffusion facilitator family transporter
MKPNSNAKDTHTIRIQRMLLLVTVLLFVIKIFAWFITNSVAILTDALESTVNVTAGVLGLYSVILSAKPRDKEHPYGHGKVEFLTSGIEGVLISIAGMTIIYKAIYSYFHPPVIKQLDVGLGLIITSGIVHFITGKFVVSKGKHFNSPVLISGGKHIITDAYSTFGLIAGIIMLRITGFQWIDSATAIVFAFIILFTGYQIIRNSISGIMDESNSELIEQIQEILIAHRQTTWIDVHNLRVIDYAGFLHIDCHLTVPYYLTVEESHDIQTNLTDTFHQKLENKVEFFIHIDPCLPSQCSICSVHPCEKRSQPFLQFVPWTIENLLTDKKHQTYEL